MAKILRLQRVSVHTLKKRRTALLKQLQIPPDALRASCVEQYLTCGKINCRCRRGLKHGPFRYLVQCLKVGKVRKFLLKTPNQRQQARAGVAAYNCFQEQIEELSQLNTELLRRAELSDEARA